MKPFACRLCPRMCGAVRSDSAGGRCLSPASAHVAHFRAHMWEEPPISGIRGSGTIFFSGCGLRCVYCQNHEISTDGSIGGECSPMELCEIMERLEAMGVHNISFVTGTHFVPDILAALKLRRPTVPTVWNSSGYERECVVDALAPYIDIWLPDYKYAMSDVAEKYSAAPDYPEKALAAIKRMRTYQPEDAFDADGIMLRGVIVRQLVLPLNTRNSIAALDVLSRELPGVRVSLMSQYTPEVAATGFQELSRRITVREYDKVCAEAVRLGIDGYMQEMTSAKKSFIPDFGGEPYSGSGK